MKKLLCLVLVAVLMSMVMPVGVLADSDQAVSATLQVMAVDRNITGPDMTGHLYGTVTYVGEVVAADKGGKSWDKIVGSQVQAIEQVDYYVYPDGTIAMGSAVGTAKLIESADSYAVIDFQAIVTGNIFYGPAFDNGSWEMQRTSGRFSQLKRAEGSWQAAVYVVEVMPGVYTFAGTVQLTGTVREAGGNGGDDDRGNKGDRGQGKGKK